MKRMFLVVAAFLGIVSLIQCTRVVANRPDVAADQLALIKSKDTQVVEIDGKKVQYSGGNFAKFKILPGEHSVTIALNDVNGFVTRYCKYSQTVYFAAVAGHTYVTKPKYSGEIWHAIIVDAATGNVVSLPEKPELPATMNK